MVSKMLGAIGAIPTSPGEDMPGEKPPTVGSSKLDFSWP